jgi:polyhydroxybutyrate depolymerase
VARSQDKALNRTLLYDDIERQYSLYVPPGITDLDNVPLVVNMHGLTSNRGSQMAWSAMNKVAEREGFLVAYPDAVNGDWLGPEDNLGFIDAIIDQVSSEYSVDASRIYATGFSQGGMMSYLLSVERSDRFAAVASVAGPRAFDFVENTDVLYPPSVAATPSRPFPVLHMHGTGESYFVPYDGGRSTFRPEFVFPPIEEFVASYAENNLCDAAPTISEIPDTVATDGSTVDIYSYQNCAPYRDGAGGSRQAEVLLYRIENGDHNWPGDYNQWANWAQPVNYDISASTEIWNFFSRHRLAVAVAPGDFNGDGQLDVADIDALTVAVRGGSHPAEYDLNRDMRVDQDDRVAWVNEIRRTYFGDANLDGQFNSTDLIDVFGAGQYEDGVPDNSAWTTGDWDGTGDFDSADFVTAFQSAGYEVGPRGARAAVPEPEGVLLPLCAIAAIVQRRRII